MNPNNIAVRNSLQKTLLELMQSKIISEISITELIKRAGVGRMSFYRNYASKEDILLDSLRQQTMECLRKVKNDNWHFQWDDLFTIFESLKPTVELIYKSGKSHLLFDYIKGLSEYYEIKTIDQAYDYAACAGLYLGILDHWASNGFKESRQELTAIFKNYLTLTR